MTPDTAQLFSFGVACLLLQLPLPSLSCLILALVVLLLNMLHSKSVTPCYNDVAVVCCCWSAFGAFGALP